MINLEQIILDVLNEQNLAGGATSAFGPGVQSTATQFSGDNYAPSDARIPKSLYGGIITRRGLIKSKKKRKKKR
jgi:hypothetical protein